MANLGDVFTPALLADWVANLTLRFCNKKQPTVLDPACGDGALLRAVDRATCGAAKIIGVDINARFLRNAKSEGNGLFLRADALCPARRKSVVHGWKELLRHREVNAIIANPPWGADLNMPREIYRGLGYKLSKGQFDTFDLFVELALMIVKPGGVIAFIIPDALFQPEHESLREILAKQSKIELIARLGEGFFPGVYRGTTVLVCTNEKPTYGHMVGCFRLPNAWRNKVLAHETDLSAIEKKLVHYVPQSRFLGDPSFRFDIDTTQRDLKTVRVIGSTERSWTRWLISGRGVELSKHGRVIYCPNCKLARPSPIAPQIIRCENCGSRFSARKAKSERIVKTGLHAPHGWRPLIVGEDVDRYFVQHSRIIRTDVKGINYKNPESYRHRKIVIRKTGVGIKAALEETGALTNQVVFHYWINPEKQAPSFLLDYFLGVLCSRVLLAFHLKNFGENEWRSHPYITQRVIADFPIPDVKPGTKRWTQAQAIADATRRPRTSPSNVADDLLIDGLVAGLFGLDSNDCRWILNVLDTAQALEPIRTLRIDNSNGLRPIYV